MYRYVMPRLEKTRNAVGEHFRARRLLEFLERVAPPKGARIVDLGGKPWLWTSFQHDFHVTLVNLPGALEAADERFNIVQVTGDATDMSKLFADQSFDVAYSNSVIEHVGDSAKQEAFAREVSRLARAYWVQTPSERCPLEAHSGVPFYWKMPPSVRGRLHAHWTRHLPDFERMVAGTRIMSRARMESLFPDARTYVESVLGIEKSYAFYRPFQAQAEPEIWAQA